MSATTQVTLRSDSFKTKNRLLNATERLFATHGFAGVTMRAVADRADTNIASAHYHYGSKEGMVMAMLKRRIEPINANRLKYLCDSRSLAGDRFLPHLRALILPVVMKLQRWCGKTCPTSSPQFYRTRLLHPKMQRFSTRNISFRNCKRPTPKPPKKISIGICI